jgi:hypothetical protein
MAAAWMCLAAHAQVPVPMDEQRKPSMPVQMPQFRQRPSAVTPSGAGDTARFLTVAKDAAIGMVASFLTNNLTVSALAGKVDYLRPKITGARVSNLDCPVVLAIDLTEIGCWQKPFPGPTIKDPNGKDDRDKRQAFRFDLEYKLGAHNLRAGLDNQNFQSYAAGTAYYSGAYYRYYARPASGVVNGATLPASATGYVRERVYSTTSGNFEVNNKATYVEDSWNVTKNVLLYAGLRSESFQNLNAEGKEFVAANNLSGDIGARFSVVRYGNVVGSRGSVAPLFQRLIAQGARDLPITDPRMTRFWITLDQGVEFVLSSLEMMRGGEILVPKIPSMTVTDLARAMAPEAEIRLVGIRPGEKLHETMVGADDSRQTLEMADRYIIEPAFVEYSRQAFGPGDGAQPVAEGFAYASDSNDDWLTAEGLRALLAENGV